MNEYGVFEIMLGYTMENWKKLGYTPIFIYRLLEHGWTYEEIEHVLTGTVGGDYKEINSSEWIRRLEEQGVEFPDSTPVIEILDRIMLVYLNQNKMKEN